MVNPSGESTNLSEYYSKLKNEVFKLQSLANAARNNGLDPTPSIESTILEEISMKIDNNLPSKEQILKALSSKSHRVLYKTGLALAKEIIKNRFSLQLRDEDAINQAFQTATLIATRFTSNIATNSIKISIKRDINGSNYFLIQLLDSVLEIKTNLIFFSFITINEIRKLLYVAEAPYERKLIDIQKFLVDQVELDHLNVIREEVKENLKLIVQHLPFAISIHEQLQQRTPSILYTNPTHKTFVNIVKLLSKMKKSVELARYLAVNDWDWLNKITDIPTRQRRLQICEASPGGFTLKFGRSQNMFTRNAAIHPSVSEIINNIIGMGSKVEISDIGKFNISIVDSIVPPTVRLSDGSTITLFDPLVAKKVKNKITKILSFGDLLIMDKSLLKITNIKETDDSRNVGLTLLVEKPKQSRRKTNFVHGIVPTSQSGNMNDIIYSCKQQEKTEIEVRFCSECSSYIPYLICPICKNKTIQVYYCQNCQRIIDQEACPSCNSKCSSHAPVIVRWQDIFQKAVEITKVQPYAPLVGLPRLLGPKCSVERIEKAILRQRHNLKCAIDATIKINVKNSPLTHFKPSQFGIQISKIIELGYVKDIQERPLESSEQILRIKPNDIIISHKTADELRRVADYIDELLNKLYELPPYYNIKNLEDLIGHIIVSIAPTGNTGIIGRIIGFSDSEVCFADPAWHATRDQRAEGTTSFVMLMLDVLLNYSTSFLSATKVKTYGTPDAIILKSTLYDEKYSFSFWSNVVNVAQPQDLSNIEFLDLLNFQLELFDKSITFESDKEPRNLVIMQLLPDLHKQIKAFGTQKFRCINCNKQYRRPPLKGTCITCDKKLESSKPTSEIMKRADYLNSLMIMHPELEQFKDHINIIVDNIKLLEENEKQSKLLDFT